VHPGELIWVRAKTAQGATCVLTVTYQYADPVDLGPKVTNANGVARWAWVVDPDPRSDAMYVMVECQDGEQWGVAEGDLPIERGAIACGVTSGNSRVAIDGALAPGEWDGAASVGPVVVDLDPRPTMATVFVRPTAQDLVVAIRFDRDLSSLGVHTVSVHLDSAPVDGSWNAGGTGTGDDGYTANLRRDWFFDVHLSTAVVPNQGQVDVDYGGTSDGSMAAGYHGSTTVVEMSHPFRSGDLRDVDLVPGETFGLSISSYLEEADGTETFANLFPWHASGQMQWAACEVPARS
jgi:hypothetical protein